MTETAKIAANNSYQRALANADSEYAEGMTDLLNNYRLEKQAEEERARAEQERAYNEIMTTVRNGEYNTVADLEKYLGIVKGEGGSVSFGDGSISAGLSDIQRQNLLNLYQTIASDPDQQAADEEYNRTIKSLDENGNEISVGGYLKKVEEGNDFKVGGYKVELGEAAVEGVLPENKTANIKEDTVFEYNGALYIKKNGTIYTVRGRGGSLDSEDYKNAVGLFKK